MAQFFNEEGTDVTERCGDGEFVKPYGVQVQRSVLDTYSVYAIQILKSSMHCHCHVATSLVMSLVAPMHCYNPIAMRVPVSYCI